MNQGIINIFKERVERLTQHRDSIISRLNSGDVRKDYQWHSEYNTLKRDLNEIEMLLMFAEIDLESALPPKPSHSDATDGTGAVIVFYMVIFYIIFFICIL